MRSIPALLVALFCLAPAAHAQGINFHWDDCTLGGGLSNKNDLCSSNLGSVKMVLSVEPQHVIADVLGAEVVIDMQVDAPALPDYWHLETGGCREGRLFADAQVGCANPPFSCLSAWCQASNQVAAALFFPANLPPNRGRIKAILAVPSPETVTFDPALSNEWYVMSLVLSKTLTLSCTGCEVPACLVANSVKLVKPPGTPGGDVLITMPAASQHVTWQGGGTISCPGATPDRQRTWGQVKTLYR